MMFSFILRVVFCSLLVGDVLRRSVGSGVSAAVSAASDGFRLDQTTRADRTVSHLVSVFEHDNSTFNLIALR